MSRAPKIVAIPTPVLREVAAPVPKKDLGSKALADLVAKMRAALATRDDGIAIAAPQIGVARRVFVVSERAAPFFKDGPVELVYVNPTLSKRSLDKKALEEGCLSVPKIYGKVRRSSRATVRACDESGREFTVTGTGLLAQIFQHETDHLDGTLFVDKAKETWEVEMPEPRDQHGE